MPMDASASVSPLPAKPSSQFTHTRLVGALTLALALLAGTLYFTLRDQTATAGFGSNLGARSTAQNLNGPCQPFTVDFAGLPAGTIISNDQYAAQGVHISVSARGSDFPDKLIVFDTISTDSSLDTDLRAPEIGNIAILANNLNDSDNDGLVDKPDENNFGGIVTFTFDSPVRIGTFIFVDHDHQPTDHVAAFDASGNLIKKVIIPLGANGSVQTIEVNADGVSRFVLDYRDSGGFKGPEIECPPGPTSTPTPPVETPTPPVETPTPPAETPTPPVATPTSPAETPTPPSGTPTPPSETSTPTPPGETPTPTPTPTPSGETPTPTPTPTPPGEAPTPTPTPTPPGETPTPPGETPTATPTPPGETPTPPGTETPSPTPPLGGETATATPAGQTPVVPTPSPGPTPSPSPVGTTVAAVPAPTGAAQAAVLGAVTGPGGGPAGVPTAGGPFEMVDRTTKLLISFGVLLVLAGAVVALATPRNRV